MREGFDLPRSPRRTRREGLIQHRGTEGFWLTGHYSHNTLPSIDDEFAEFLERAICDFFGGCDDSELRGFWCDGVSSISEEACSNFRQHVLETREYHTVAWIGTDGQDEFRLRLLLGDQSARCISQDEAIVDCIPSPDASSKFEVDVVTNAMTIKLD